MHMGIFMEEELHFEIGKERDRQEGGQRYRLKRNNECKEDLVVTAKKRKPSKKKN